MKPSSLNTKNIIKGDTFTELFIFTDASGTPYDLTIYDDIAMDIRRTPNERGDAVASLKLNDGITIDGSVGNRLVIRVSAEDTNGMRSGIHYRDVRVVLGDSVNTILSGQLVVYDNITKIEV
jgi:tRNA threonylcarbamoyladenosine modification (KEOPS) complex  Pcc1 subunit